jgi:CobQ-like glutamine amidotransferase family enzyme
MSIRILSIAPDILNPNGDAENARVLLKRAEWAGLDAEIVEQVSELPDVVVIGSGFEADIPAAADALRANAELLRSSADAGVPILAVATGFELLSDRIELAPGEWLDGLGILAGHASLAPARISGDLVVESSYGELVGFENHPRSFERGAGVAPLGRVTFGEGNGSGSSEEGAVATSVIGTHLHGPVLARNPALADHLLRTITGGAYDPQDARAKSVDRWAELSKSKVLKRVKAG